MQRFWDTIINERHWTTGVLVFAVIVALATLALVVMVKTIA